MNPEKVNHAKSQARLIECKILSVSHLLSTFYKDFDGEVADSIQETLDDLNASINQALDEAGSLRNLIKWDGLK